MNICLLVSGKLGFVIMSEIVKTYNVRCVLTDKNSEEIISYCAANNIVCYAGNPRNGKVRGLIDTIHIDVLLSVNYIYLIDAQIISWPSKYAINVHGSLLPKFRGRTPHVWAIINNEKEAGIEWRIPFLPFSKNLPKLLKLNGAILSVSEFPILPRLLVTRFDAAIE